MIDAPDQLLAVRFSQLANPVDDSDWLDVQRRARNRRTRFWLALPLAAALAALVVGSAFAFYGEVVDFFTAEPAPERIVVDFEKMRGSATTRLGPNVIPGEARKITSAVIGGEGRPLYVAPTSDGGFCWRWDEVGSCGRIRPNQPSLGAGWLESEHGRARQIYGYVLNPETQQLELRYEDGLRTEIRFVWVTAPIDAGFYQFEVPPEHLRVGHHVAELIALAENGNEIARQEFLRP
jgi:hypothetical protein